MRGGDIATARAMRSARRCLVGSWLKTIRIAIIIIRVDEAMPAAFFACLIAISADAVTRPAIAAQVAFTIANRAVFQFRPFGLWVRHGVGPFGVIGDLGFALTAPCFIAPMRDRYSGSSVDQSKSSLNFPQ